MVFLLFLYKVFYSCSRVYTFINDKINFNLSIWQIVFSTQGFEDFGSPKAGSDSTESLPCKLTQILSQELHVISSLLVCMLINNNIIVLFTETLCRAFDCKYIIFALMNTDEHPSLWIAK